MIPAMLAATFAVETPVPTASSSEEVAGTLLALGLLILGVVGGVFLLRFYFSSQSHKRGAKNELVVLLVRLPKFRSEEQAKKELTQQEIQEDIAIDETIFGAIAGLRAQRGFRQWLLGRTDHFSFEMVAHEKLIKFYVAVPRRHKEFMEQQITAQHSDAFIEEVEDYNIFSPTGTILGAYLVQKRRSVFPIKSYRKSESDPLNALTNVLSKVPKEEGAAVQVVVRSAHKRWRKLGVKIARNMQQGMRLEEAIKGTRRGEGWLSLLFSSKKTEEKKSRDRDYQMSETEKEMVKGLEEKASKGGLDVNIRIMVSAQNPNAAQGTMNNILGSFAQFNIYQYGNAFTKVLPSSKNRVVKNFIYRAFDEKHKVVLNTEETASVWHLPLQTTETPNILWLGARTAPAPPNIPEEGLKLGYNEYRGKKTDIHLKRPDRQRHMYIIGKSGSGKTVFIQGLALQDILNGEGVCVLDPHGDMIEWLLGHIPKNRIDDVVLFDPSDIDRPVGLNMLEVANEEQMDMAVQEMIAIFYKLFPPEMIGPMFEHHMRNAMLTLMSDIENPGTITEIPRMFSDTDFQMKWRAKVTDPVVKSYWENEVDKTSDFHKSEMLGYLISKVGRFVENAMMRNIIGQQKSGINFRDIMDNQKILLVNLAKGKTGEVNSSLLGMIIVSKLQMNALARADMPEEERKDFYLYIDEFQNFVTDSIATILSEARKYKLDLVIGHQYMGQLVKDGKAEIRDAVLGNVGSMFVSRVGPEDTETLEKVYTPTFSAYDLINSDKFTWYVKMIVDNSQVNPFTMRTLPPEPTNPKLAKAMKDLARLKYGRDRAIVEADILERSQIKTNVTQAPPPPQK